MRTAKWGILGYSESIGRFAAWLQQQPHHQIVAMNRWDAQQLAQAGLDSVPQVSNWTDWLGNSGLDIILVARDDFDERRMALRQLAEQSMLLVVELPERDPILACELAMFRDEQGTRLVPFYPPVLHPYLRLIKQWLDSPATSPLGTIEQLQWERRLAGAAVTSPQDAFAPDAILLRSVLGPVAQLQTMKALSEVSESQPLSGAMPTSLNLRSTRGVMAGWSGTPSPTAPELKIVARSAQGEAVIAIPDQARPWQAELHLAPQAAAGSGEHFRWPDAAGWDSFSAMLAEIERAERGEPTALDWEEAYRATELTDLMELSGRRGKTLDISNEQVTERDTFRGMMSAAGCFLLLLTTLLLVPIVLLDSLFNFSPDSFWRKRWPLLICLPMLAFLLLQCLQLVFPPRRKAGELAAERPSLRDR